MSRCQPCAALAIRSILLFSVALWSAGHMLGDVPAQAASPNRPNVIVIYTDDHGYADLGCQGVRDDVKTPHTDRLAAAGVRCAAGYSSAPQCRPSRAGVLTGRYQNRFGLESNGDAGLPWSEQTIAERLAATGYVTGMCGKWHVDGAVGANGERVDGSMGPRLFAKDGAYSGDRLKNPGMADAHGFSEYLCGSMRTYVATHDAAGRDLGGKTLHDDPRFRIDVQAQWAESFIGRHAESDRPFFLYVAFFAPHVPLEAPQEYLDRFPGEMPRRRRLALAMISAVDDGVGRIRAALRDGGVLEDTLIFYISDNGAPLKIHKMDAPGGGAGWDGSLNDPWIGEKGMLTEGGMHVPFLVSWPRRLPQGAVCDRPVIALDAAATALAAAGLPVDESLDGVDLAPALSGESVVDPHDALYWRWVGQAAIREGNWKYLQGDGRAYLFDLGSDEHETRNLLDEQPETAARLRAKLLAWSEELLEPGLDAPLSAAAKTYFDHYLDGKLVPRPSDKPSAASARGSRAKDGSGPAPRSPEALHELRDRDKDGFVTLEEYVGNPEVRNVPVLTKRFRQLDTDQDGKLTLEEMRQQR